ncbi:MAG: sigma-54-dependent transcriptional regulator [Desulfomonilaceae bacterium]
MGAKVLLVDDEKDFVEVLAERLQNRGFEVRQAFNGEDAIDLLNQQDADVVILDVLMPGKDGVQTLSEIKQLKPLTEVIMLTGYGTIDTAIQGMKFGAYDYLMKPTETEDLVVKINKAYKLKSEHEERIRQAESSIITENRDS